jgi:hypothetical protein
MNKFTVFYDSVKYALDRERKLREAFMEVETMGESRNLYRANKTYFRENPRQFSMVENANMRIRRIHNEQMKSWHLNLN